MDILSFLLASLLYPGIGTAVLFCLAYRLLTASRSGADLGPMLASAWNSREGVVNLASALAAILALALLPWPYHPLRGTSSWLWSWAAFEIAFLVPLIPALASGAPQLVRPAIRNLQIGALARAVLWANLAVGLSLVSDWRVISLPVHVICFLGAILAFPMAIGWGVFGEERSVTPQGVNAGLPDAVRSFANLIHDLRASALLLALLIATLPISSSPAWIGFLPIIAGFLVVSILLRRLEGRFPRLALPSILRFSWIWVASLTLLAIGGLAFVQ